MTVLCFRLASTPPTFPTGELPSVEPNHCLLLLPAHPRDLFPLLPTGVTYQQASSISKCLQLESSWFLKQTFSPNGINNIALLLHLL